MAKKIAWAAAFIVVAALLQSTLFSRLALYMYAGPDLALLIVVYCAYLNGSLHGEILGFLAGFLVDLLSQAPVGFHMVIFTAIGALAGLLKGNFFLDFILLPLALCAGATAAKAAASLILYFLFSTPAYSFSRPMFWVELALNTALGPFLFALLNRFRPLLAVRREAE
ncbi:MAG: rod shape-determining protein MreD [Treponema sp.]|jgi:rod shape-determining protein MreD|nr:rod shape-determining protein MreD [Treponema sp.]